MIATAAEIQSTDSNSGTAQLVPIPFSVWPLVLSSEPAFCSSWATTSTTLVPWQLEQHPKAIRPHCNEILSNESANKWSPMMICQSKWQALTRPKNDQREWKRLRAAATMQSKVSCKLMRQGHLIVATTTGKLNSLCWQCWRAQKTVMNRRLTEPGESQEKQPPMQHSCHDSKWLCKFVEQALAMFAIGSNET